MRCGDCIKAPTPCDACVKENEDLAKRRRGAISAAEDYNDDEEGGI